VVTAIEIAGPTPEEYMRDNDSLPVAVDDDAGPSRGHWDPGYLTLYSVLDGTVACCLGQGGEDSARCGFT
jgi:hypothetical protein